MPGNSVSFLQERIDADWQAGLMKKGHQAIIVGDERNVLQALRTAPELHGLVRHNEFALKTEITRSPPWRDAEPGEPWTDDDDTALMGWLQGEGIAVRGRNVVADCVTLVAKDWCFHPVREYLNGLHWDGVERLSVWLSKYMGATGDPGYLSAVGRCWLISAVARVMQPGCKADHMLVLESSQGAGKSTAAALLAIEPAWFADNVGDVRTKDAAIQLSGRWIIELSELSNIRRAEVEAVKGYLSRTQDVFRPPYGRRAVSVPRQCVFVGTTNEREYLRDRTGNRRYWPVSCRRIALDALRRDRDQLWAEALHAYRAGEAWHLEGMAAELAAAEQESRLLQTELDVAVAEYLERAEESGRTEITSSEVFTGAFNLHPGSEKYAEQAVRLGAQVAAALKRAGWSRITRKGGAKKRTIYRKVPKTDLDGSSLTHARAHIERQGNSLSTLGDLCAKCLGEGCACCRQEGRVA